MLKGRTKQETDHSSSPGCASERNVHAGLAISWTTGWSLFRRLVLRTLPLGSAALSARMRALLTLGLDELNELPGHAHCLFVATRVVRSSDEPLRATPEPDLREGGVHRADKAVYV